MFTGENIARDLLNMFTGENIARDLLNKENFQRLIYFTRNPFFFFYICTIIILTIFYEGQGQALWS
jgi:hypothetical protein